MYVQEGTRLPVKGLIVFKILSEHVQEYSELRECNIVISMFTFLLKLKEAH